MYRLNGRTSPSRRPINDIEPERLPGVSPAAEAVPGAASGLVPALLAFTAVSVDEAADTGSAAD